MENFIEMNEVAFAKIHNELTTIATEKALDLADALDYEFDENDGNITTELFEAIKAVIVK